jgi:hypothetical protein
MHFYPVAEELEIERRREREARVRIRGVNRRRIRRFGARP